jgi:protein-tyrosine-phosphatase
MKRILVPCTGNSARSQMGEAHRGRLVDVSHDVEFEPASRSAPSGPVCTAA